MANFNDFNWENVQQSRIQEIIRQAELRLADQLSSSFSRDQRASSLLSILVAITLTAIGAIGSFWVFQDYRDPLFSALIALSLATTIGSFFAMRALKSKGFNFSGNEPKSWLNQSDLFESWGRALSEQAEHYQEMIEDNENIANDAAENLNNSILFAFLAPIIFLVVGVWVSV